MVCPEIRVWGQWRWESEGKNLKESEKKPLLRAKASGQAEAFLV